MFKAVKAYLKSSGSIEYRDCKVSYYTYYRESDPTKFGITVNVELHYTQNNYIKTLSIDEVFSQEQDAINYGLDRGRKAIDKYYELGKISVVKPGITLNDKNNKVIKNNAKPKVEKSKSDKR